MVGNNIEGFAELPSGIQKQINNLRDQILSPDEIVNFFLINILTGDQVGVFVDLNWFPPTDCMATDFYLSQ